MLHSSLIKGDEKLDGILFGYSQNFDQKIAFEYSLRNSKGNIIATQEKLSFDQKYVYKLLLVVKGRGEFAASPYNTKVETMDSKTFMTPFLSLRISKQDAYPAQLHTV